MTDKLKPCPFCGGDDFFVYEWHDFVSISCRKCGTEVGPLWNTRPIEDKKDEEIKRLREALEEIKKMVKDTQEAVYIFPVDLDDEAKAHILEVLEEVLKGGKE